MKREDVEGLYEAYSDMYSDLHEAPKPQSSDLGYRIGRGITGALRDLPSALSGQLTGRMNPARIRQAQRGQNLTKLLSTGKLTSPSRPVPPTTDSQRDPEFRRSGGWTGDPNAGRTPRPSGTRPGGSLQPRPAAPQTRVGGGSLSSGGVKADPRPSAPVKQTGDKEKDTATWAKANPTLSNKPKTFNPLMQKTFGYQTGYAPDQVKGDIKKMAAMGSLKNSFEWEGGKTLRELSDAYRSVYEAKKVDQDKDGDNDFADVRIARMIASGVPKEVAIAKVKNKSYNEETEIDEAMVSGPRKDKMKKLVSHPRTTTRDRGNIHNIAVRNDTGSSYEKKSTGGKGSRFPGYGDRGAGNKAARRSGNEPMRGNRDPRNEDFNAIYEIVASYLLENNFAEDLDAANNIIEHMSSTWVGEILESYND